MANHFVKRTAVSGEVINLAGRRELFVDDFLIDRLDTGLRLMLHRPVRREIVFKSDAPWEGNASSYQSIVKTESGYRIYYHGGYSLPTAQQPNWCGKLDPDTQKILCVIESTDGLHWHRPNLGFYQWKGIRNNNIVMTDRLVEKVKACVLHTAFWRDENPSCPAQEKYKAVIADPGVNKALYLLVSPDGLHFSLKSDKPFWTQGVFDSQNLAFWDPVQQVYRIYYRVLTDGGLYPIIDGKGLRQIAMVTTPDFEHFSAAQDLTYQDQELLAFYTNQVQPYLYAPHILMGFPMRYVDHDEQWDASFLEMPGMADRVCRAAMHIRYGTVTTDAVFMSSRDGVHFQRWNEAFIRPGPRQNHSWVYGDNFIFWGMIPTPSATEDAPDELSLYATEGYWQEQATEFRRYTIRRDGFVSVNASYPGGEFITRPFTFEGGRLTLNAETSAVGKIAVEIQDAQGLPIKDYALADCCAFSCDSLNAVIRWKAKGSDVRALAGRPIRLRFVLRDADLYALQFMPFAADEALPEIPKDRAGSVY